jgi:hypothetical protein
VPLPGATLRRAAGRPAHEPAHTDQTIALLSPNYNHSSKKSPAFAVFINQSSQLTVSLAWLLGGTDIFANLNVEFIKYKVYIYFYIF